METLLHSISNNGQWWDRKDAFTTFDRKPRHLGSDLLEKHALRALWDKLGAEEGAKVIFI